MTNFGMIERFFDAVKRAGEALLPIKIPKVKNPPVFEHANKGELTDE